MYANVYANVNVDRKSEVAIKLKILGYCFKVSSCVYLGESHRFYSMVAGNIQSLLIFHKSVFLLNIFP